MFRHFRSHHKRRDPLIRNLAASYSSELLTIYLGRRIEACPLSQSWPGYFNRASKFGEQPPSLRMATNTLLYGHYARRCVFRKCFISVVGIVSTPAAAFPEYRRKCLPRRERRRSGGGDHSSDRGRKRQSWDDAWGKRRHCWLVAFC
jgi:hypothetical protein